jgi:hypothetical protein
VAWQGSEGDVMVETEQRDGIRVLALRRPPVNAIDLDVARSLAEALRAARTDDACRGVVVTGMPGVFSAGIDTRVVPAYDASTRAALLRTVNRTILELYGLPKPTVAAISGHALGGALVVALACDVRLAARGAFRLGLTEAAAGIPFPAGPLVVVGAELSPEARRRLALAALVSEPDGPALTGVVDRRAGGAPRRRGARGRAAGGHARLHRGEAPGARFGARSPPADRRAGRGAAPARVGVMRRGLCQPGGCALGINGTPRAF